MHRTSASHHRRSYRAQWVWRIKGGARAFTSVVMVMTAIAYQSSSSQRRRALQRAKRAYERREHRGRRGGGIEGQDRDDGFGNGKDDTGRLTLQAPMR